MLPSRAMPDVIRIANAGGYWGDDLAQFKRQVELGPVDYVTLDFLAEITMSIMQKQRARDPRAGFARDFTAQVEETLPLLVERRTRVISNAAGVTLDNMEDGAAFAGVRERVSSANAYYGAWPVVEALKSGAQIVVTGRC